RQACDGPPFVSVAPFLRFDPVSPKSAPFKLHPSRGVVFSALFIPSRAGRSCRPSHATDVSFVSSCLRGRFCLRFPPLLCFDLYLGDLRYRATRRTDRTIESTDRSTSSSHVDQLDTKIRIASMLCQR